MATIKDVAAAAGVSPATVSYALRGDSRIIPATAQKVLDVASQLHYNTNLSARSLRSGKNGVIGIDIYELDMQYPSQISAAIAEEAQRQGLQAIVQQTCSSQENEISILSNVTSQLCDGVIFSPGKVTSGEIKTLIMSKPVVLLDNPETSSKPLFDTVFTPCEDGAQTAINHLIDIGCQHIGIVGTSYDISSAGQVAARRLTGCLKAFAQAGIHVQPGDVINTAWRPDAVRKTIRQFMQEHARNYDGLFCMTDTIALGVLRGLADCRISVPDDMAVIGFDGIYEGDLNVPSLTTIAVDFNDLAKKAVRLLIHRIRHPQADFVPIIETAKYSLVKRESTQFIR